MFALLVIADNSLHIMSMSVMNMSLDARIYRCLESECIDATNDVHGLLSTQLCNACVQFSGSFFYLSSW